MFHLHGLLPDVVSGITFTLRHPLIPYVIGFQMIIGILIRPYVELVPGVVSEVFEVSEHSLANMLAAAAFTFSLMVISGRRVYLAQSAAST